MQKLSFKVNKQIQRCQNVPKTIYEKNHRNKRENRKSRKITRIDSGRV